jgi:hypothetical protein
MPEHRTDCSEWRYRQPVLRRLALIAAVTVSAAVPASAAASVRLLSVTSPINHGAYATLAVSVTPTARCSITVYYKSGPSEAQGLVPQRGRRITWTWKVGTRTTPGRWPIVVSCGSAGTLHTSFVVR